MLIQADASRLPFADQCVDLVLGSPPYCDARTYGIGAERDCRAWIDWMLGVTAEALRVSKGAVVWVAAGVTRDRNYWPACEGLMYEWWRRGGSMYRPAYWKRYGIPGSGGDQWLRADVEYVMLFKRDGALPWSDNTAMGRPPICGLGGPMSNRNVNGTRVRLFNKQTRRRANGVRDNAEPSRPIPDLANPGNLIDTGAAGGGNIGSKLAHENEAPYPEKLAEFFIRTLCPPGGLVCDPFSGSGTTCAAAIQCGRRGVGSDIRMSQCGLGRRRLESGITADMFACA